MNDSTGFRKYPKKTHIKFFRGILKVDWTPNVALTTVLIFYLK